MREREGERGGVREERSETEIKWGTVTSHDSNVHVYVTVLLI